MAVLLAFWLALTVGAAVDAAQPARVLDCSVIPGTISRRGATPETIRVSFAIEKDALADLARFTATGPAGSLLGFSARGTFAKGVVIADRILDPDPTAPLHPLNPGAECMLTYLHFADGSSWTAP